MVDGPDAYEVRTGFNARTRRQLAGCLGVVIAGLVALRLLPFIFAIDVLLGLGILIFAALAALAAIEAGRHRFILRVDAAGITLAPSTSLNDGVPRGYSWPQVAGLVVWKQVIAVRTSHTTIPSFGVLLTADAADALGLSAPASDLTAKYPAAPLAATSVAMTLWTLDRPALTAVLGRVAPGTPLVDVPGSLAGVPLGQLRADYLPPAPTA